MGGVQNYHYLCSIPYHSAPQTEAKSVPHPDWEKMVYFMCSSLDMKETAVGSAWSTQKDLLSEAELEVQVLKQLVQEYICKQSPKGKTTFAGKTTSDLALSELDLSSVCVMFPTRLTVSVCVLLSGQKLH